MVDVKMHKCFPTIISEFSYHPDLIPYNLMKDYIKKIRKNHMYHTDDILHNVSYFLNLKDVILNANKDHLKKLDYKYEHLEITGMWANYLYKGDAHPPHTHSNNFLSGVYYLEAEDGAAPIQFFDPRPQANVLRPRNNPNIMNSSMIQFDAIKGVGYIFPSWLQHWVPSTNGKRISISWNIILRGEYGEPGTLQNAYI
jgi:uncharacterized protein (TIGR02466 family)